MKRRAFWVARRPVVPVGLATVAAANCSFGPVPAAIPRHARPAAVACVCSVPSAVPRLAQKRVPFGRELGPVTVCNTGAAAVDLTNEPTLTETGGPVAGAVKDVL